MKRLTGLGEGKVTEQQRSGTRKVRKEEGSWIKLVCVPCVVHRSKSQITLFYAHMNKANGARKICKLLSNWPVRKLKPCQPSVRVRARERTQRITGLVSAAIHCTFH